MSKCMICEARIARDSWRFLYVIRESSSLRDKRNVHADCLSRLPEATRAQDRAYVQQAKENTEDPGELHVLEAAALALA